MAKNNRDEFAPKTKLQIARRAGYLCSFPTCRTPTSGATSDGESEINIGTAAHICAAAPGGPRYDEKMTSEERASASNGIWMCRDHGTAIDSADPEFTVDRLREWKKQAQIDSWQRVLRYSPAEGTRAAADTPLLDRILAAANADLHVFRQSAKWPATSVALSLEVEGFDEAMTTAALAGAAISLDDLILIAPPGMGKTATLFQIAEHMIANGYGAPLIVPLGDWAVEGKSIIDSILERPAFRDISEADLRNAATRPGLALLLDGWNELDLEARRRARRELTNLQAQLPGLGFVVTTRRQALDVPFEGAHVDLLPLSEDQQLQIAAAMRGDLGRQLLDRAWRTSGVRDLVTIPLYLTVLLSLPEHAAFPETKEELLQHFVTAHEKEAKHAEALHAVTQGCQQNYLIDLAIAATRAAGTSITEFNARRSVSETATWLAESGQIANKPEPMAVLEVLTSNHVLVRTGGTSGYSFQHQQFQEWYTSHYIERRITEEIDNPERRDALKAEIFNLPEWEEAILFAVERLARGSPQQVISCGKAILAAFEVDPMLAAEMIFRSTEAVWKQIAPMILEQVNRWHAVGTVDRATRFMLTSGRPEFFDQIWPLITHENDQISLRALRNCRQFRPSILGSDPGNTINSLPSHTRKLLLSEITWHSGVDGLDLAAEIAKDESDPDIIISVAEGLAFRGADRHVALVLQNARDDIFDRLSEQDSLDEVDNDLVRKRLADARERRRPDAGTLDRQLRSIVYAHDNEDRSTELTKLISEIEIGQQNGHVTQLIYEAQTRYPVAVADGLLARLLEGRTLLNRCGEILASAGFSLDDDALLQLVLQETEGHDSRIDAAASVLGALSVGKIIDALADVATRLRDANGQFNRAASSRYHELRSRLSCVPASSLVAAVQARSSKADNAQMALLAELLSRDVNATPDREPPFSSEDRVAIRTLIEDWGARMLASGNAERQQTAALATLASRAPDGSLLPLLQRLLDDNLRRFHAFREEAAAANWSPCKAVNEARSPMMHEYQRAFIAIDAPETTALMITYLGDPHFGDLAASVLAAHWKAHNEQPPTKRFFGGTDFGLIKEKRAAYDEKCPATSDKAEAIFAVVEQLLADSDTDEKRQLATALGTVAVRLPHGKRDATIDQLITLTSRRGRPKLLQNLILSGVQIDFRSVLDGLSETLEAAKKEPWILIQNQGYEWRQWLRLLPFTNDPMRAIEAVDMIPEAQRNPWHLTDLVDSLSEIRSNESENILFEMAEKDPRFYQNHNWSAAIFKLNTPSAACRLIDLMINGALDGQSRSDWSWAHELARSIAEFPEVREYVYRLLKEPAPSRSLELLALATSDVLDMEGLLLLVEIETEEGRSLLGWHTIERAVTERIPVGSSSNTYEVIPSPAGELRKQLLARTTDGGPADAAARCLNIIDAIRDEHGLPMSEPRHPDIASEKPWPIMTPDPFAIAG